MKQAKKATHFIQPQKASKVLSHLSGILRGKELGITKLIPLTITIFKHAVNDTYGKKKGQTQQ